MIEPKQPSIYAPGLALFFSSLHSFHVDVRPRSTLRRWLVVSTRFADVQVFKVKVKRGVVSLKKCWVLKDFPRRTFMLNLAGHDTARK